MGELEKKRLKTLSEIENLHKGKVGYVCGMGPSLKPYLDEFSKLSLNKAKNTFVCCNDYDLVTDINADFWVIASSVMTVSKLYNRFNAKPNTTLAYACTADITNSEEADKLLTVDYLPYDQRHFLGLRCSELINNLALHTLGGYDVNENCCVNIKPETIQEFLKRLSGYDKHYGTGETVALHMLALAIILGLNPIYIVGVELDYTKGYVDDKITNNDSFEDWMPNLLRDFYIINESAKKLGVEIINLSPESKLQSVIQTEKIISQ